DPLGLSEAILTRPTIVVVFDAVKDTVMVVTPVRPQAGLAADAALARAVERLLGVVDSLDMPLDKEAAEGYAGPLAIEAKSNTTPEEFRTMVRAAKEYIGGGDAVQVGQAPRFDAP